MTLCIIEIFMPLMVTSFRWALSCTNLASTTTPSGSFSAQATASRSPTSTSLAFFSLPPAIWTRASGSTHMLELDVIAILMAADAGVLTLTTHSIRSEHRGARQQPLDCWM